MAVRPDHRPVPDMQTPLRTDLRSLILSLALAACVVTLINCLYAAYRVERQTLIQNSLTASRAYSAHVASSIDQFLREAQSRLRYSAARLSGHFDDPTLLVAEVERLQAQDSGFDAVIVAHASGRVMASSPESLGVDGRMAQASGAQAALRERKPLVSDAYTTIAGNLVVFVSVPIFDRDGKYLGFIGGSLHLRQGGMLHTLVSGHIYLTDVQIYVVDTRRALLFHSVEARIGTVVGANPAIDEALRGRDGSVRITDARGQDVLSGFAHIPTAHWGLITQRPIVSVLAPLKTLMTQIVLTTLPLAVIGFLLLWWLSALIARPLRQLAENTNAAGLIEGADRIAGIKAWYFEASNIRQALLHGIRSTQMTVSGLEQASHTDPLTGLLNRRAMDAALAKMEENRQPLAIVALDIDHFKRVNDTWGHDMGDKVLQRLAALMREGSREQDLPCRVGGEEFLLLLPHTDLPAAVDVGERLRRVVEQTPMDPVGHITISLGVTIWPRADLSLEASLKEADELMYQAKREGRNRLVAFPS